MSKETQNSVKDIGSEEVTGFTRKVYNSVREVLRYEQSINPSATRRYEQEMPEGEYITENGFDFGMLRNTVMDLSTETTSELRRYQKVTQKAVDRWDYSQKSPEELSEGEYVNILEALDFAEEKANMPFIQIGSEETSNLENGFQWVEERLKQDDTEPEFEEIIMEVLK